MKTLTLFSFHGKGDIYGGFQNQQNPRLYRNEQPPFTEYFAVLKGKRAFVPYAVPAG